MDTLKMKTLLYTILFSLVIKTPILAQNSLDSLLRTLPETCRSLMQQRGWPSLSIAIVTRSKDNLFSGIRLRRR